MELSKRHLPWLFTVVVLVVAAAASLSSKEKPNGHDDERQDDEPKSCAAGFALDIVVDQTKPNGKEWDALPGDEPPDPSGKLTLHDGDTQTEVFLKRTNAFKVTAPFFNGKQRKSVARTATFDLNIVDVDAVNFNWFGGHVSSNDYIAHFRDVSLASLLDGESVENGSATLTGARCLSD